MKKLCRKIRSRFILAFLLSVFFPAGILSIVFGATNGIKFLLVAGIIMTVLGFYGTPLAWVNFAKYKSLKLTLFLIEKENIYSVDELSNQQSKNKKYIVENISKLIEIGCLTGYLFVDKERLVLNENRKQGLKVPIKEKCPNCGGLMDSDGTISTCSYCGLVKRSEKKN